MRKSRFFILLITILLLGCTNRQYTYQPQGKPDQRSLGKEGLELIRQIQTLARDKKYIQYCSHSEEINRRIREIAQQDYTRPEKVFIIDHLQSIKNLLPDCEARQILANKLVLNLPSTITSQNGSTALAATSLLISEKVFLYPELKENTIYLYIYKGNYQCMVVFRPNHNHIVQANAFFIIHPHLNGIKSPKELEVFFKNTLGLENIQVCESKADWND